MKPILFRTFYFLLITSHFSYAQTWSKVGDSLYNSSGSYALVQSMNNINDILYVGGGIEMAGPITVNGIATWDSTSWDSVGTGMGFISSGIFDFEEYDGNSYVGGGFSNAGDVFGANKLAKWDGTTWSKVGGVAPSSIVNTLQEFQGRLYVGGGFGQIDTISFGVIASWNGISWDNLNGGMSGGPTQVKAMAVYNDELYVGGTFNFAGGIPVNYLAKWNGTQWNAVGSGFNDFVNALYVDTVENVLYVGGPFTALGDGTQMNVIAKYDGTSWDSLPGLNCSIYRQGIAVYRGELYVAGCMSFSNFSYMARWDADDRLWRKTNSNTDNTITSLKVYKDELYVGGAFTTCGGLNAKGIAKMYMPPQDTTGVDCVKKKIIAHLGNSIPNPAQNQVLIPYTLFSGTEALIQLYSTNGQLLSSYPINSRSKELEISLGKLAEGVYIYTLEAEGQTLDSKHFVVTR